MKKITLTLVALGIASVWAYAGPEPMMSSSKEVQQPVVEKSCFDGWYFGIHGGGTYSNFDQENFADEASLGALGNGFVHADETTNGDDGGSAQGGIHLGYNWHRGHWVFGIEGDLSATALDQNNRAVASVFLPNNDDIPFTTAVEAKSTIDWYSTLRPRIGWAFGDRAMVFITGGLAFGDAELRERTVIFAFRDENPSIDRNSAYDDEREIAFGWTAGGGFEFCLSQHVSLSFTYLYTDLNDQHAGNDVSFVSDDIPRSFDTHSRASSDNNFHVFQGGLSFHF